MSDNNKNNNNKYYDENNSSNSKKERIDIINQLFTSNNFRQNRKIIIGDTEYKIDFQLDKSQNKN